MKAVTKLCKLSAEIMAEIAKIPEDVELEYINPTEIEIVEIKFKAIKDFIRAWAKESTNEKHT